MHFSIFQEWTYCADSTQNTSVVNNILHAVLKDKAHNVVFSPCLFAFNTGLLKPAVLLSGNHRHCPPCLNLGDLRTGPTSASKNLGPIRAALLCRGSLPLSSKWYMYHNSQPESFTRHTLQRSRKTQKVQAFGGFCSAEGDISRGFTLLQITDFELILARLGA